jgi:NAD(P) transhydrogenase subunit alpha
VITTANVPDRKAPVLITAGMVAAMRPGSVIVDLAAESGGNCALTRAGEDVLAHGVHIWAP